MRYEGQLNLWNREQVALMRNYKNWFNLQVVGFEPKYLEREDGEPVRLTIISITLLGFTFLFSRGIK